MPRFPPPILNSLRPSHLSRWRLPLESMLTTRGGIIMIIGAILQTAAVDYAMMLVARVVTGVGNGLLTSTVPAYQSECAKPHRRGQLVLFEGSLITFGIMISYWVNVGFFFTRGSISWRFPIAIQILFAIVMIVGP